MKCVCMEYVEPVPFPSLNTVHSWDGTEAAPSSGSGLVPPFLSTGIPPAAGTEGGSHSAEQSLTGKEVWGSQRHRFAYTVKPTRPMEIIWATLSALCSHRQNYKHIRVSFCSSEGKLPCYSFPLPFYWLFVGMQTAKEKPDFLPVIHLWNCLQSAKQKLGCRGTAKST